MLDAERISLMQYRLEKAHECLSTAEKLLADENDYATILNRSYYAVFHAMRAVLALEQKDFKKHSALMSYFRQQYIKPRIFSTECSDTLDELFQARQKADYEDFYLIAKADAAIQLSSAKAFVAEIERYLQDKLDNQE